ncbi:MAG: hypothetical protein AAGA90_14680 [Actinomycetota bacterium]
MDIRLVVGIVALLVAAGSALYNLATGRRTASEIRAEAAFGLRSHRGEVPAHLRMRGTIGERLVENLAAVDSISMRRVVGTEDPNVFAAALVDLEPASWIALTELSPEDRLMAIGGDGDPARHTPTNLMSVIADQHGIDVAGFNEEETKVLNLVLETGGPPA